jgi:hypothetical protein
MVLQELGFNTPSSPFTEYEVNVATTTYEPIETYTLGSTTSSVTFGAGGTIPQTYTDLIIVTNFEAASTTIVTPSIRFNGDTGTNYSNTTLYGQGSSATSVRFSNRNKGFLGDFAAGVTSDNFIPYIISINNYSNSTTYKTFLCRYNQINSSSGEVGATVGLWRNTNAITSVTITSDGGQNFAIGSTFTLYGIANADIGAKATGGVITYDNTYYYHTFAASGTFTPKQSLTADILVVAGGGGGGFWTGGGGGAGGLLGFASQSLTATGYTVTIGNGGAGGTSGSFRGTNGGNSQFGSLTASVGGGGGGGYNGSYLSPNSGGSGGGATSDGGAGAAGTSGQGSAGGAGIAAPNYNGGGGGGAGGTGGAAGAAGGIGGAGSLTYSSYGLVTGTGFNSSGTVYYAGGGGGGANNSTGGTGTNGGGNGSSNGATAGRAGTINSGSGGGGGGWDSTNSGSNGGNGGSGVVIVRYAK